MDTREADVELLRLIGVWPSSDSYRIDENTVQVAGPPQEELVGLRWNGWDAIHAHGSAAVEELERIAAAVHRLRSLTVETVHSQSATQAVAHVIAKYSLERLHLSFQYLEDDSSSILAATVGAWLLRPIATALELDMRGSGWEGDIASGLRANQELANTHNKGLRKLALRIDCEKIHVWAAPLLQALQGHKHLEEVRLTAVSDGELEEDLSIRLAHMPALKHCRLFGLGKGDQRVVDLEVVDLPALRELRLIDCGLVELPHSLLDLPSLERLFVRANPLVYPPARLCARGWGAVRAYLAMGEAGGRGPAAAACAGGWRRRRRQGHTPRHPPRPPGTGPHAPPRRRTQPSTTGLLVPPPGGAPMA